MNILSFDALVVGSGAAGLTAALELAPRRVAVLTKGRLGEGGSSAHAQGGVAAAVGPGDSSDLHAADTLTAGAGLNDPEAVELLTAEGPRRVMRLIALGAEFDRSADGALSLGREAAHSRRRILHAQGDATGAEIMRTLKAATARAEHITLFEETFAWDLIREGAAGDRIAGVTAVGPEGEPLIFRAPAVILATGGLGRLFSRTTNPAEVTGDGLAMAARAGARLVDVEMVQFHPTALAAAGADPLPLLTEALRGEGAVLVDSSGERFMLGEHPDAELAPRDVVARAIRRRRAAGTEVFLDAREAVGERFPERFPTVFRLCRAHGLDPRREPIPVSPAAHYHMGGIATDQDGRASLPGLWACGEAASTGVHGANRLASNSLLEALVFGARVAASVAAAPPPPARLARAITPPPAGAGRLPAPGEGGGELLRALRRLAWTEAGVERTAEGLERMLAALDRLEPSMATGAGKADRTDPDELARRLGGEGRNLLLVARLVATAALARTESRGGHFRSDYPEPDPRWRRRLAIELDVPDGARRGEPALRVFALPALGRPAEADRRTAVPTVGRGFAGGGTP